MSASSRFSLSCCALIQNTLSVKFVCAKIFSFMVEQISSTASGCVKPGGMGVSRASSLDVMKCFAAFCVVWIHYGHSWLSPIVRCAVPIFFVITGYYYPMMVEKGQFWRHIRKLVIMVLCASALYGAVTLTSQIWHDTLGEWVSHTFRLRHIVGLIIRNDDMFSFHLWYFYAVLYDLIIFYLADKWKLTKILQYATPALLLLFLIGNFTPWFSFLRNFLFMGLPCMMIGRCIRENKDKAIRFLSNERYLWIYTFGSLLLACGEMWLLSCLTPHGSRNMYIFTLPMILPCFYWSLSHPRFGEGSWIATIGRKYSAYIYIFHVLAFMLLWKVVKRDASLVMTAIYPFLVFGISLCMAWVFVKIRIVLREVSERMFAGKSHSDDLERSRMS